MKKYLLSFTAMLIITFPAFSQQLENPGFEDWEDAGTVKDEPVDWSSIKTSDAGSFINNSAPLVWDQSTNARTGDFCLKLINKSAFGIVATGMMTNGRVHADFNPDSANSYTNRDDPRWNTPFTWRPDSLAGWFKFYPKENDRATVKAVLHVGEGTMPEGYTVENWVGVADFKSDPGVTFSQWTRFSVPFVYDGDERNPEYLLIVVTSGDGTTAVDSSYAFFDDLEVIYNNAGIDDPSESNNAIYIYNRTIHLEKLPRELRQGGTLTLLDLSGRSLWSSPVNGDQVKITQISINEGVYILSVSSGKDQYRQKVYIR